jgi:hypothetical protein
MASSQHLIKQSQLWDVTVSPTSGVAGDFGQISITMPGGVAGVFEIQNNGPDAVQIANFIDRPLAAGAKAGPIVATQVSLQTLTNPALACCVVSAKSST